MCGCDRVHGLLRRRERIAMTSSICRGEEGDRGTERERGAGKKRERDRQEVGEGRREGERERMNE